jgi:hypothetical protein
MKKKLASVAIACSVFACAGERPSFMPSASDANTVTFVDGGHEVVTSDRPDTDATDTTNSATRESDESETSSQQTGAQPTGADSSRNVSTNPACNSECCRDEDCADGFECRDSACECKSGKACDGACIAEEACCADADCGQDERCNDEGTCECDASAHLCGSTCLPNDSPASCGAACEPCVVPAGGQASCDGTKCTATCHSGQQLCAGSCIPEAEACDANCSEGQHECDGVCFPVTSALACGDSCEPCLAPANAIAKCEEFECAFDCEPDYLRCDDTCVPPNGCCGDGDCEADKVCETNRCVCADGTKECGDVCIPNSGCCVDTDCGNGLGCKDNHCVDAGAPQVTQVSPADAATGVLSNASIKLTFSEPMDQASVQSALSISTLSSSDYILVWNGDGSQLTITPADSLSYAAVSNLSGAARSYTVGVTTSAQDLAGNRLQSAFSSSFATMRRVTQSLSPTKVGTGSSYGWAVEDDPPQECPTGSGNVSVGNHSSIAAGGTYYTWTEYDLSVVGQASQIATLESVKFVATQGTQEGGFYPGGVVNLSRCEYGDMSQAFVLPLEVNHGAFATSSTSSLSKDITSGFLSSWTNGEAQRLYRLSPEDEPTSSKTFFACSGFALELIFLAP